MEKIFFIMGKSGSGKSKLFSDLGVYFKSFKKILSHTTRDRRYGEVDKVDYYFDNDDRLSEYKESDDIIELRTYHTVSGDKHYYTLENELYDNSFNYGLMVVTPDMLELIYDNTMKKYPDFKFEYKFIGIYLDVKDNDLLIRSINRESLNVLPRYDEICRRYLADKEVYDKININRIIGKCKYPVLYDIPNNDYNECLSKVIKIILENIL